MDLVSVPILVIRFLLLIGCTPTTAVYQVNEPIMLGDREVPGIYCPYVEDDYCPEAGAVYIHRDSVNNLDVLVHELYHSCQAVPKGTRHWKLNEQQAQAVTHYWREWNGNY